MVNVVKPVRGNQMTDVADVTDVGVGSAEGSVRGVPVIDPPTPPIPVEFKAPKVMWEEDQVRCVAIPWDDTDGYKLVYEMKRLDVLGNPAWVPADESKSREFKDRLLKVKFNPRV